MRAGRERMEGKFEAWRGAQREEWWGSKAAADGVVEGGEKAEGAVEGGAEKVVEEVKGGEDTRSGDEVEVHHSTKDDGIEGDDGGLAHAQAGEVRGGGPTEIQESDAQG